MPMLILFSIALLLNVSGVSAATGNNSTISPQKTVNNTTGTNISSNVTYTPSQINTAATKVTNFYNTNQRLPNYVTINNHQVTMPQFLWLLAYETRQINNGTNNSITFKNVTSPKNATETVKAGTLTKTEYLNLAQIIKSNISSTGKAPNNVNSSLGKIRFETLIYTYSKILNFYVTNHRLPNTVSVNPWSNIVTPITPAGVVQTVDNIMIGASKYRYISGISNAAGLMANGGGDCWAMSDYLYQKLTAAHVHARIIQYATAYASNHRSVQCYYNGAWVNVPYRQYFSTDLFNDVANSNYSLVADNKL